MSRSSYDVVVIGGGIHGAGALQAAAAGGYRAVLLEKNELAHGTSSRSSKLIHGGLRYLETAQFALVQAAVLAGVQGCEQRIRNWAHIDVDLFGRGSLTRLQVLGDLRENPRPR